MSYDVYTGLLKVNSDFESKLETNIKYDFSHPLLPVLREKYRLDGIAGKGNDLSRVLNLLHWISEHIMHNGNSKCNMTNALEFLDYAFDKGTEFGINCAMISNALAGCLISIGIYAREVKLTPCSPYDFDSHRVVHAYIDDLKKWIMLDPSYSGYVMDKDGNILNVLEIRNLLAEQEYIIFNNELNYNGQKWANDSQHYKEYLAKNSFCLSTPNIMCFDSIKNSKLVYVCPKNFNIKQRDIYCINYKMKKSGSDLSTYLKHTEDDDYLCIPPQLLIEKPL